MHQKQFDLGCIPWNNAPPTFFPKVQTIDSDPSDEAHRRCRGTHCMKWKLNYPVYDMWFVRGNSGNIVYYCQACKDKYRGDFVLVKYNDRNKGIV